MLVMAIAVTIFLLTFVLPKFTPLFNSRGMQLPAPTRFMMAASHYLMDFWYLWLAATVVATVGYFWGRRTEAGRKALDWVKISLPIVGPMCRKVTISRSIRNAWHHDHKRRTHARSHPAFLGCGRQLLL